MYPIQILISSKVSSTSSFVRAIPSIPDTSIECLTIIASNQPHLLSLPVTVPNSLPIVPNFLPTSHFNSDGNGPLPTLVVYAFTIPRINPICFIETPDPVEALLGTVFEEVTNGYVP